MGSVNKVILVGNLGRDAELRYTPGGSPVATLNLATTEIWNDKAGQRQEKPNGTASSSGGRRRKASTSTSRRGNRSTSRGGCRPGSGTTRTATSATRPKSGATVSSYWVAGAGVVSSLALPVHPRKIRWASPCQSSPTTIYRSNVLTF